MQHNIHLPTFMKEKIIALAACLFLFVSAIPAKSLVLTLRNGTLVYYLLGGETNPMLRFVEGDIVVNTDKYAFSNVKNFYISATDDPSGITHIMGETFQYDHNIVVVNTEKSLPIKIYACDGHKITTCSQQVKGQTIIDLNPLPQGVYIVAIGESSLKIFKK